MPPVAGQVNEAACEPEVYRYVMQSFQAFEQAVASRLIHSGALEEVVDR